MLLVLLGAEEGLVVAKATAKDESMIGSRKVGSLMMSLVVKDGLFVDLVIV